MSADSAALLAQRLQRTGAGIARVLLLAGAGILLLMLLLTCADVFGRYILNAPVNGKTELTRFMMAGLIACALPVVSGAGGHITVDLLDRLFDAKRAAIRDFLVDLLCSGALLVLAYWLVFRADRLLSRGYVSDFLHLPMYPVAYFVALMTAASGAALAVKLLLDAIHIAHPALRGVQSAGSAFD